MDRTWKRENKREFWSLWRMAMADRARVLINQGKARSNLNNWKFRNEKNVGIMELLLRLHACLYYVWLTWNHGWAGLSPLRGFGFTEPTVNVQITGVEIEEKKNSSVLFWFWVVINLNSIYNVQNKKIIYPPFSFLI